MLCGNHVCVAFTVLLQVDPADVVIVEGILVLHVPKLREMLNMKIYVDTGEQQAHLCSVLQCVLQWIVLSAVSCVMCCPVGYVSLLQCIVTKWLNHRQAGGRDLVLCCTHSPAVVCS